MGSSHDSSFQRINPREKGDWKSGDQVARVPRKGGQAHEEAMASVGDPKSWSTPIRDLGIPPSPPSKSSSPKKWSWAFNLSTTVYVKAKEGMVVGSVSCWSVCHSRPARV